MEWGCMCFTLTIGACSLWSHCGSTERYSYNKPSKVRGDDTDCLGYPFTLSWHYGDNWYFILHIMATMGDAVRWPGRFACNTITGTVIHDIFTVWNVHWFQIARDFTTLKFHWLGSFVYFHRKTHFHGIKHSLIGPNNENGVMQ